MLRENYIIMFIIFTKLTYTICSDQEWNWDHYPDMSKTKRQAESDCALLEGLVSEEEPCYISNIPITCPGSAASGVVFVKRCRPFYMKDGVTNSSYLCENCKWTLLNKPCQPDCGIKNTTPGKEKPGENPYPWLVSVNFPNNYLPHCSGSIISPYHVLTASQCTELYTKSSDVILAADPRFSLNRTTSQIRKVKKIVTYPNYSTSNYSLNNIEILEVDQPFNFSATVNPVCIDWDSTYEDSDFQDGNHGESLMEAFVNYSTVQIQADIVYRNREVCEKDPDTNYTMHFTKEKFCAIAPLKGSFLEWTGAGRGLYFKSDGSRYYIRGILNGVSATHPGNGTSRRAFYTRVSNFLPWLREHLGVALRNRSQIGCILPNHLERGTFEMADKSNYIQNTLVSTPTIIFLACTNVNNEASGTNTREESVRTAFVCIENKWFPSIRRATCSKSSACPSIQSSTSEKISCNLRAAPVDCVNPQENTTAIVRCQPFYTFEGHRPIYKCENGKWDQEFSPCVPECGIKRAGSVLIRGTDTPQIEHPWVVGIYDSKNSQICTGSIISRYYILSAAQCFTDNTGQLSNKDDYVVAAGKYYRDLSVHEPNSQRKKIKSLIIHEDYAGNFQLYRSDLALIELDEPLTLSMNVQPVCMDWSTIYEEFDFVNGNVGVTAGWGITQEGQPPSNTQSTLPSLYRSKIECLKQIPKEYSRDFLTSDKICIGYQGDDSNVFQRDTGSGLYFQSDGKKFYIRGVASTTIKSNVGGKSNYYTMYTKVSKYIRWIETKTRNI